MGYAILHQAGGGGVLSEDVTAAKANVLKGTRTITSDSGDEIVEGTMVNNGAVDVSLPINGEYLVPAGYHNGTGKVKQSITTKAQATHYAGTAAKKILDKGQYLSGDQYVGKISQTNLSPGNILNGTTVKINNGSEDIYTVTGTRVTPVRNTYVSAVKGYGASENVLTDEDSYTMQRDGVVYYGMCMTGYGGYPKAKAELLVNNVVKQSIELTGNYQYAHEWYWWLSENVSKNDVVKIRCTITQGTNVFCAVGAHMAC